MSRNGIQIIEPVKYALATQVRVLWCQRIVIYGCVSPSDLNIPRLYRLGRPVTFSPAETGVWLLFKHLNRCFCRQCSAVAYASEQARAFITTRW